jgi:hypothetical protein
MDTELRAKLESIEGRLLALQQAVEDIREQIARGQSNSQRTPVKPPGWVRALDPGAWI